MAGSSLASRQSHRLKPLSERRVVVVAAVVLVLAVVAGSGLWWWISTTGLDAKERSTTQLQAVQIALSIGVAGGGLFALYLAFRRQAHTEHDATERLVTELYTKAVDQLGSDQAAVRLGGLYALERLAQDNPTQRQTIVNVLCAYLRMPYALPGQRPTESESEVQAKLYSEAVQQREARHTAQNILETHLRPGPDKARPAETFWPNIDLNLNGALLIDLDLGACVVRKADFRAVRFSGDATFMGAQFFGDADFRATQFSGAAGFEGAEFSGVAGFEGAQFSGVAWFDGAQFSGDADFGIVQFSGVAAGFEGAQFSRIAWFMGAQFSGVAGFEGARFAGVAGFEGAHFSDHVNFGDAQFFRDVGFVRARFSGDAGFVGARFSGDVGFWGARFSGDAGFVGTQFSGDAGFEGAQFENGAPAELVRWLSPRQESAAAQEPDGEQSPGS